MSTSTIDPQITQLPQQTFQQAAPGATPPAPQAQPAAPPVNHGHNLLKALVNGAHQAGQLMYNVNNPDQAVERSNQQQDQLKQLQNQHDEEYRKVIYAGITDPNSTPEQRQALGTLLQHLGDPNVSENDRLSAFVKGIAAFFPQNPLSPEDRAKAERIKAGLDPRAGTETQDMKPYRLADGSIAYVNVKDPKSIPQGATPILPNADQPKGAAPLESGGVTYAVRGADGKEYFASDLGPHGDAPPEAKQLWNTMQDAKKAKQDEEDKKERERQDRFIEGQRAIADRLGQSEQFQADMASFRSDETTYRALDKQARDAEESADLYSKEATIPGNKSAFDKSLITDYTSILAKGGRKTQAEIAFAQTIGTLEDRFKKKITEFREGELPVDMRKLYVDYLKTRAESLRKEADEAKPTPPEVRTPEGPKTKALKEKASGTQKKLTAKDLEAILP